MNPVFSVVIPTLNEATELAPCLSSVRSAASPAAVETLVADGGSADGTLELARKLADRALSSPPGRGPQLNAGGREARGRFLVFLHADCRLPPGWDEALLRAWSEPGVALTAFSIDYGRPQWSYRLIEASMHFRCRRLGMVYGDHALATRQELFHRVGGFPDTPLFEDVGLVRRLRREGRLLLLPEKVRASPRRQMARGPLRNALSNHWLLLRWRLGASPEALAKEYARP